MKNSIVRIEHLSHRYSKDWAIRDINFEIEQNGILGLLGSNGAGKSTTMNILCGVLNQTEGQVYIDGINLRQDPEKAKRLLGFLPQNAPLHLDLTALTTVLTERRKELVMRGQRWTDLRRLNKDPRFAVTISRSGGGLVRTLPANDIRYTLLIPQEVITYSTIGQNPR